MLTSGRLGRRVDLIRPMPDVTRAFKNILVVEFIRHDRAMDDLARDDVDHVADFQLRDVHASRRGRSGRKCSSAIWLSSMDSLELAATSTGTTVPSGLITSIFGTVDRPIRQHEEQGKFAVLAPALFGEHFGERFVLAIRPCRRRDNRGRFLLDDRRITIRDNFAGVISAAAAITCFESTEIPFRAKKIRVVGKNTRSRHCRRQ